MNSTLPFSPAADRNKQPILEVLQQVLPTQGEALEIASGTGQHVTWFAQHMPAWRWQPTDTYGEALLSIAEYAVQAGVTNVRQPVLLDVMAGTWLPPERQFDVIYCANMLHISPWATCAALMQGAARHLAPNGVLITYGPYLEDTVITATGNLDFDSKLRADNPAWGIRRRESVEDEARQAGLTLARRFAMPANNLLLFWMRAAA